MNLSQVKHIWPKCESMNLGKYLLTCPSREIFAKCCWSEFGNYACSSTLDDLEKIQSQTSVTSPFVFINVYFRVSTKAILYSIYTQWNYYSLVNGNSFLFQDDTVNVVLYDMNLVFTSYRNYEMNGIFYSSTSKVMLTRELELLK